MPLKRADSQRNENLTRSSWNNFSLDYRKTYYLIRPWKLFYEYYRKIKWVIQRGLRGYADCDVWSLDMYLVRWLPDAINKLRTNLHGYPIEMTSESWDATLQEMETDLRYAQLYLLMEGTPEVWHEYQLKGEKGLDLFRKHFYSLWD